MVGGSPKPLSIPRAMLIGRLERTGPGGNPGNDRIREKLVSWAEDRASHFYIYSGVGTPLNQIGAPVAADDVMQWLEAFDQWVADELGLNSPGVVELVAAANDLAVEEVDGFSAEELGRLRGIRVLVTD